MLTIPIGAAIIVAKEAIDIPALVADKIIKALSKKSKAEIYSISFLLVISLSSSSAVK